MKFAATALLLLAAVGAARAEQPYGPPASADAAVPIGISEEAREQAAARALAERRRKMIEDCEQNLGSEIDCTRETDTELRAEGLQSGVRVIHLRPAHP